MSWLPAEATADDIRAVLAGLSDEECERVRTDWRGIWARREQIAPAGAWRTWIIMAGRGFGKTRTGAEQVRAWARNPRAVIALVGPTSADCRDVMVEGESGLLGVFPDSERPTYQPSKRRVMFASGAQGFVYSAEEPERLRGPQHSAAWADEIAVYPEPDLLWDNLQFGLRLGSDPRIVATTTPKPSRFLKRLIEDPMTRVTRGSTFDNRANLPDATLAEFTRVYGGTRIGRQELEGELLEEAEGALWSRARIDQLRVKSVLPELVRIAIAIDPATTSGPDSDETGMIAAGVGTDGHGYVLRDLSGRFAPDAWANRAVSCFDALDADRIVAEGNNGGDLVESVLRTVRRTIPYTKVTASRGKVARAEPVAALYEQGKIHHVGGFPELEDEMANFVPGALTKSPNRVDALVWAFSYLMLKPKAEGKAHFL